MIEACIYINTGLLKTLQQAASKAGLSKHVLAHRLFCKVMQEKRLAEPKVFTRVRYQEADPEKEWTTVRIKLRPDMFEKCHDLRKGLKMSVSLIFVYAIKMYLEKVLQEYMSESTVENKLEDNSLLFYSIHCIFDNGVDGYIIKWTKKPEKPKI